MRKPGADSEHRGRELIGPNEKGTDTLFARAVSGEKGFWIFAKKLVSPPFRQSPKLTHGACGCREKAPRREPGARAGIERAQEKPQADAWGLRGTKKPQADAWA